MAGFLFAFLVTLVLGTGARDQVLVARLAPRPMVLVVGVICTAIAATAIGWAGIKVAPMLNGPARSILVAMALALAAIELVLSKPGAKPLEPTQSLGALAIVLLAQQLFDATRFAVFAIAAASPFPPAAIAGGVLGSAGSILTGWLAGDDIERLPLVPIRRSLGLVLMLVAGWLIINR